MFRKVNEEKVCYRLHNSIPGMVITIMFHFNDLQAVSFKSFIKVSIVSPLSNPNEKSNQQIGNKQLRNM